MNVCKVCLMIGFILTFVNPAYGFILSAISITLLAYSDVIREYVDKR